MNEPLSPAAQAVLDAFLNGYTCNPEFGVAFESDRNGLAAALEAAADQVVPTDPCGNDCCITQCEQIRADLLAIAAELEANEL